MVKASPNNTAAADKLDIEPRSHNWRQACQWRAERILRFANRQNKERKWIRFTELAERYGHNIGIAEGYEQLQRTVMAGKFERKGRSRVLYLHPAVTAAKMTREKMRNAVETFPPATVQREYLGCCWIPLELAEAWRRSHNIGLLVSTKQRGRARYDDGPALAEMRRLTASGLSAREAAKVAAAICGSQGASDDAKIDRLRSKFACSVDK